MRNISSVLIAGLLAMLAVRVNADSIEFYSGVSSDGIYDDNIHMLTGPIDGPLTNDFTDPNTFAAALNGPSAYVVSPNSQWAEFNPPVIEPPPFDEARVHLTDFGVTPGTWISSDPNGGQGGAFTALYAYSFILPDFTDASFHIQLSADQTLGTTPDDGMFFNGIALAGGSGGDYSDIHTLDFPDVTSLLHAGTNTLYLYNANYGGPAGVLFDAHVDFTPAPVPEPATITLFGFGTALGLIFARRRS